MVKKLILLLVVLLLLSALLLAPLVRRQLARENDVEIRWSDGSRSYCQADNELGLLVPREMSSLGWDCNQIYMLKFKDTVFLNERASICFGWFINPYKPYNCF